MTRKQLRVTMLINLVIAIAMMVIITIIVRAIGYDMELPPIGLIGVLALFWTLEKVIEKK